MLQDIGDAIYEAYPESSAMACAFLVIGSFLVSSRFSEATTISQVIAPLLDHAQLSCWHDVMSHAAPGAQPECTCTTGCWMHCWLLVSW